MHFHVSLILHFPQIEMFSVNDDQDFQQRQKSVIFDLPNNNFVYVHVHGHDIFSKVAAFPTM